MNLNDLLDLVCLFTEAVLGLIFEFFELQWKETLTQNCYQATMTVLKVQS